MRWGTVYSLCAAVMMLGAAPAAGPSRYANPLLESGPDPWVLQAGGIYYYTHTLGNRIALWRTRDLADLAHAETRVVWYPPASGPDAHSIWAPELHRFDGRWFIYYSATASGFKDDAHRGVFVLENPSADPFTGQWISRGRVNTAYPGIDGTVFTSGGARYFAYSPYIGAQTGLAIARMANPWTLTGHESVIARPDRPWEERDGRRILEGPAFLRGPRGDLFLTYSAAPCWSDDYAIGLLRAARDADPLDPKAWRKLPDPVLKKGNGVYATGHNGFFTSPDGRQNWIIYHANSAPGMKCTAKRAPHIQRFTWTRSGWPRFGLPAGVGRPLPAPSGRYSARTGE